MSIYELTATEAELDLEQFVLNQHDPSLNSELAPVNQCKFKIDRDTMNELFLSKYRIEYISDFSIKNQKAVRVLSFPQESNTCYEKADILPKWNPLNVIKAFYLESSDNGALHAVIVPETGCF